MSLPIFLLCLLAFPFLSRSLSDSQPDPRGYLLNCGATDDADKVKVGRLQYITDKGFVSVGNTTKLSDPNLVPILSTIRYFPEESARKYCYVIPVLKGGKYLVRTTYYYGGFDGGNEPPVFDQIVDGTKWGTVDTTEDYKNGLSSFYEIVVVAMGKTMSVCLARNQKTVSSPFISALELEYMDDSLYNSTDFTNYALATVARSSFGNDVDVIGLCKNQEKCLLPLATIGGRQTLMAMDETVISRFPDDQFNRQWEPFMDQNPFVDSQSNITSSDFWNLPPAKAMNSGITTSRGKSLEIDWPPFELDSSSYYVALYFQDNRTPSPFSWRVFNVEVNGKRFYTNLNVTAEGATVYGTQWALSGRTKIVLSPAEDSPVGPVINAGEILQIVPLGGRTLTRDVMAMEDLARSFNNPPPDWSGDPCLPKENSWTGVTCSGDTFTRVVSLNLTDAGLYGSLPQSIANLTALTHLWLGGNHLTGTVPDMSLLKELQTLHLENNEFEGPLPQLPKNREMFLQNNKFDDDVSNLQQNKAINIQE